MGGMLVAQVVRSAQHGGIETHVYELIKAGIDAGYRMVLISLADAKVDERFRALGIEIITLNDTMGMSVKSISNVFTLYKALKRLKPDVVHSHGTRPIFAGPVAAYLAGIKKIVTTVHNSYRLMSIRDDGSADKKLLLAGKAIYLSGCALSGSVITDADWLADEVKGISGGVPFLRKRISRKLSTIHIGIDADLYGRSPDPSFREKYGIGKSTVIIGAVSRLDEPKKGIGVLLKAGRILKDKGADFKILIVGDGDSKRRLLKLTDELGLNGSVIFLGFWKDLPDIIGKFDIFVLPSLSEGFPIVNLEAMASSLPVVSTEVGGVPEAVKTDVNGILVPPGDERRLAEALLKLISDPAMSMEMGKKGRAIVEKDFRKKELLDRIIALYSTPASACVL